LRVAVTALPGIIRAGSFLQRGEWVWDVRNLETAVTIHLAGEQFVKLAGEEEGTVATGAITTAICLQARS
jgi:hypothetical protein